MAQQDTPTSKVKAMGPKPETSPAEGKEWYWTGTKWDQRWVDDSDEFVPAMEPVQGPGSN